MKGEHRRNERRTQGEYRGKTRGIQGYHRTNEE